MGRCPESFSKLVTLLAASVARYQLDSGGVDVVPMSTTSSSLFGPMIGDPLRFVATGTVVKKRLCPAGAEKSHPLNFCIATRVSACLSRDLVLRDEPAAGGDAPAAASGPSALLP